MNHRQKIMLCCLVIAGLLLPMGFASTVWAQEEEQRIVALVNDTPISAYDITQRLRLISVTTRQKPTKALRKRATEELISETIQLQEARKNGVIVAKDEVDRALESVGKRNKLTGEKLISALAGLGVGSQTIRQRIEAQIAWQRVVRAKFRSQISVGDVQVDQALSEKKPDENAPAGKKKTEFQLQRVRLELPENPDQKTIARRLVEAEKLRARVKSCSQINDAIRRLSKSSVKQLGRKTADQVVQPTRALLTAAETGHLTPAYVTSSSVELYAVCGRKSIQAATNDERRKVEAQLIGQEFEILALRHLRDLRQEAFVEFR